MRLQDIPGPVAPAAPLGEEERARLCAAFGYAHEDIEDTILPMAVSGVEPTVSMGADEPLAALSHAHPPLFAYFKQRFAQVTNPPIDAIREKVKTDESVYIGDDGNLLSPAAENCRVIELDSPILTAEELERIRGPVSYTHLDVYKRQPARNPARPSAETRWARRRRGAFARPR